MSGPVPTTAWRIIIGSGVAHDGRWSAPLFGAQRSSKAGARSIGARRSGLQGRINRRGECSSRPERTTTPGDADREAGWENSTAHISRAGPGDDDGWPSMHVLLRWTSLATATTPGSSHWPSARENGDKRTNSTVPGGMPRRRTLAGHFPAPTWAGNRFEDTSCQRRRRRASMVFCAELPGQE